MARNNGFESTLVDFGAVESQSEAMQLNFQLVELNSVLLDAKDLDEKIQIEAAMFHLKARIHELNLIAKTGNLIPQPKLNSEPEPKLNPSKQ